MSTPIIEVTAEEMARYEAGYRDGRKGKVARSEDRHYRQGYSTGHWLRFDEISEPA